MKIAGSGSIRQRHGSANPDPDPHQNVMDPEHWLLQSINSLRICGAMFSMNDPLLREQQRWTNLNE